MPDQAILGNHGVPVGLCSQDLPVKVNVGININAAQLQEASELTLGPFLPDTPGVPGGPLMP